MPVIPCSHSDFITRSLRDWWFHLMVVCVFFFNLYIYYLYTYFLYLVHNMLLFVFFVSVASFQLHDVILRYFGLIWVCVLLFCYYCSYICICSKLFFVFVCMYNTMGSLHCHFISVLFQSIVLSGFRFA